MYHSKGNMNVAFTGLAIQNRQTYSPTDSEDKINCCGATAGSEQQHNQDLKEIYKGQRILEFITFYHNALHLTTLFTTMHCV